MKCETTISRAHFAELAGRIASNAASWSSDCLTLKDRLDQPMTDDALERFTAKMQEMLGYINERQ